MLQLPVYQVDAFADALFKGNPAAVCPLDEWLPDILLQQIAAENNLPETAFYVPDGEDAFHLRWFTPVMEVDLCGHATLATAFVLFSRRGFQGPEVLFRSRCGLLRVKRSGEGWSLDFPADVLRVADTDRTSLEAALGVPVKAAFRGRSDYLLVVEDESTVQDLQPDLGLLERFPVRGVIVTAAGREVDFVSRFFAPQSGIAEDPVTGSAHTTLTPYWAAFFHKNNLTARQLSARGGALRCELAGSRVFISGKCHLYLEGNIFVPAS